MSRVTTRSDLVFRLSCWGLATIAFGQLLVAGVALAGRVERARVVRIVEVPKVITVAPEPAAPAVASVPPAPKPVELPPLPESTPLPPPRPLAAPPIADPEVERLVTEARKARLADDMASALMKLETAHDKTPDDPNVLYELGLVYEEMAMAEPMLADRASDAFLEVMKMGTTGAGELYELASKKIEFGISMPTDKRGEIVLGRPQLYEDKDYEEGQRVVLIVPIHADKSLEMEEGDMDVKVTFYDSLMIKGRREIVPTAVGVREENVKFISAPYDYATGEEKIQFTYILPRESAQNEALFGRREFYGYVVELIYKGEVLDARPYPRHLAVFSPAAPRGGDAHPYEEMPEFLSSESFNDAAPLLPNPQGDFLPEPPAFTPDDLPPPPGD